MIMGPDKFSSLTATSYYVRSLKTGRSFYTDDVVQPPADALLELPGDQPVIRLEGRGERASPPTWSGVPTRRLRSKTILFLQFRWCTSRGRTRVKQTPKVDRTLVFMFLNGCNPILSWKVSITGSDEESWSLKTDSEETSASSHDRTPSKQSNVEEPGGGDVEEAPNDRAGGAHPVASNMTGTTVLRCLHNNLTEYIKTEYEKLDAATEEQSMWIGALAEALTMKMMVEHQLQDAQGCETQRTLEKLD